MRIVCEAAVEIAKKFEGCSFKAYLCPAGKWTIGYGHTRGVKLGDQCSIEQALRWLYEDMADAARIVEQAVTVHLNDNQFGALADFVFNIGPGVEGVKDGFVRLKNGNPSTLLRRVNAGEFMLVPTELMRWVNAGGVKLPGLVKRRKAEAELWEAAA